MGRFSWQTLHVGGQQVQVRTWDEPPDRGAVYLCPAVGEYPIYDDNIYQAILEDERRNTLFRSAIRAAAPGATVLEIGCAARPARWRGGDAISVHAVRRGGPPAGRRAI